MHLMDLDSVPQVQTQLPGEMMGIQFSPGTVTMSFTVKTDPTQLMLVQGMTMSKVERVMTKFMASVETIRYGAKMRRATSLEVLWTLTLT